VFLYGESYSRRIKELFASQEPLDAAIAFWGDGAQKKALGEKSPKRRIICNLGSGCTNPVVVKALSGKANVSLRTLDNLHAKVVIGRTLAIIGSANFSANGLGLEDGESAHWEEAGYEVTDPKQIAALRNWFDNLWKSRAKVITPADILLAEELWDKRRANRPFATQAGSSFKVTRSNWTQFRDRNIWLIVWSRFPTEKERQAEKDHKHSVNTSASAEADGKRIKMSFDYYHDWEDTLCDDLDAHFIDVQWIRKAQRFKCQGARRPLVKGHFPMDDTSMDVLERVKKLEGFRFGGPEKEAFTELMNRLPREWVQSQCENGELSLVIRLDEALGVIFA
jgi:hypothetical protein